MVLTVDCIIFCSGKSGSTTLANTLIKNDINCIKIHSKYDFENIKHDNIKYRIYKNIDELINVSIKNNKKLYFIDSYRLPIERKISGFFQNIHKYIPDYEEKSIEYLINIFNEKYLLKLENYHSINSILDEYNIKHFTKFDFNKKFIKKEFDNLVFIKILFKDIKKWNEILSKIFNKNIILFSKNTSKNKSYFKIYQKFKEEYKLPKNFINEYLMNDKEFKIYNTKKEQDEYIKKWLDRSY